MVCVICARVDYIDGTVDGLDILVPYQRQVLELCDLVLLAGNAEQRHLDLVVLGHGGVGYGLGQGHVGLRVGRLDQRPYECLGCLGGLGACRAGGDVDRVDDSFEAIYFAHKIDMVSKASFPAIGPPKLAHAAHAGRRYLY